MNDIRARVINRLSIYGLVDGQREVIKSPRDWIYPSFYHGPRIHRILNKNEWPSDDDGFLFVAVLIHNGVEISLIRYYLICIFGLSAGESNRIMDDCLTQLLNEDFSFYRVQDDKWVDFDPSFMHLSFVSRAVETGRMQSLSDEVRARRRKRLKNNR